MIIVESEGDVIFEYGRDTSGKVYCKKIRKKPYFYYAEKKGLYTSLTGIKCSKCVCNKPKDIEILRDNYIQTFEDDVKFTNRHIIDEYHDKEIENQRIRKCYIDIEVDDSKGYVPIEEYQMEITVITIYDNFLKKYFSFILRRPIDFESDTHNTKSFKTEKELLEYFLSFIKHLDPDLLTAWNVNFDISYILNRMSLLGIDINKLSRMGKTFFDKEKMIIKGRIITDLLHNYKILTSGQLSSYSLEFVSQKELKEGKEKYLGLIEDLDDDKFLSYNKRDVELLVLLDEKIKIIDFFNTLRRIAKCNFNDTKSNKRMIDSYILCRAKTKKIVLPSSNRNAVKKRFEGAYVKLPPKGLHEWVSAFDLKSLYPSIIMQFNMSFETIIPHNEIGDWPKERVINIHDKVFFRKDIKGFAPEIMEELMQERTRLKKLMFNESDEFERHVLDMKQAAVKRIMNAFYGVNSAPFFRLFCPDIASSITNCGRDIIKRTESFVEESGKEVIIADTDSVYVKTECNNLDEALEYSKLFNQKLDLIWNDFLSDYNAQPNRYIIMEHEKVYSTLLTIGVKKRYSGLVVWKDDKILERPKMDTKGFSIVRSDFPSGAQKFLKNITKMILEKCSKEECLEYIKNFKTVFKSYDIDDVGFPTSIRKKEEYKNNPIQKRAAENSEKWLNIHYMGGSKIKYYFVKRTPRHIPFDNVFVFKGELPEGFELDWDRIFERIINNPLEPVFESLGWRLHTTLLDFFTP